MKSPALRVAFVTLGCASGGFVTGLGYVAAVAKFWAASASYTQLLDVGHQQFMALHNAEWVLIPLVCLLGLQLEKPVKALCIAITVLFFVQMLAIMPGLDARMLRQIAGEKLPASPLHVYYLAVSGLMMVLLLVSVILAQVQPARQRQVN